MNTHEFIKSNAGFEYLSSFNSPSETPMGVKSLAHSDEGQLIEFEAIEVTE